MRKFLFLLVLVFWPTAAHAQQGDYGVRIPARVPGWYAPVGSRLIGSHEQDHTNRGSPTLAWDWSASVGSPIYSVGPGVVRRTSSANEGGYGWNVVIDHGDGYSTLYAHCLENSFTVRPGQRVEATTQICAVGRTGMTSWPHVHLNIDKNGVHQPVGNYFDSRLVRYCHFTKCQATNDPRAPVTMSGVTVSGQTRQGSGVPRYQLLLRALADLDKKQLVTVYFVGFLLVGVLYWLGNLLVRVVLVSLCTGLFAALIVVWLVVPPVVPVAQAASSTGGDNNAWEAAWSFMRRWEGSSCTHDPVRTFAGVTNTTYNAWRQRQGLGPGDVCRDLTAAQMKAIYHDLFWVESGASALPTQVAIFMFDWYVNAGYGNKGAAKQALAACGANLNCLVQRRLVFYQNCGTCSEGHFNRLRDIVAYLGGK